MRTNIVIDDALMNEALKVSGAKTKREAVELALKAMIRLKRQAEIKAYRGKLHWDGDLDVSRSSA
jgi:Arc/MetJ family transcription regulator